MRLKFKDLELTDYEVACLSPAEREERVHDLIRESNVLLDWAIHRYVTSQGKKLVGVVALFSGGNDSTVLTHLMRDRVTHVAHANTTIGIEETREFVRKVCADLGLPLIERKPPRIEDQYRSLILDQGFPGPGHHFKMFQRLKERPLRQVRNELVHHHHRERVVFVAGRRRQESDRRANVPELERDGSVVWVSPMVNWTRLDCTMYRRMFDVPRNEVADLCHMSGECLCGAFARDGERSEVEPWFPDPFKVITELEQLIADRVDIPEHRKTWGWGGDAEVLKASRSQTLKARYLCSACKTRVRRLRRPAWAYEL